MYREFKEDFYLDPLHKHKHNLINQYTDDITLNGIVSRYF